MNPAAAAITLTGHAPLVIAPLYPATGSVEVTGVAPLVIAPLYPAAGSVEITGVAPSLVAGTNVFVFPAAAVSSIAVVGLAPALFVYNEASINFTRVTVRPVLEGRVRINRG